MTNPIVLLLPGLLCSPNVFARQAPRLLSHAKVVIPDVRRYPSTSITDVAHAVLDEVKTEVGATRPPLFVAGFSYGGYIALEMARISPHDVSGLALLFSQAREDTPSHMARRRAQISRARESGVLDEVLVQQANLLLSPSKIPPNYEEAIRGGERVLTSLDPVKFSAFISFVRMGKETSVEEFIRQQECIMSRRDCRPVLAGRAASHTHPNILLLAGEQDPLIPVKVSLDLANACHAAIATASSSSSSSSSRHVVDRVKRVVLPDCAHMGPLEQPSMVAGVLEAWLLEGLEALRASQGLGGVKVGEASER
jgi:pimeloyl-ACP methyl ester carboxylesterase